jgi:hypothetical protein
LPRQSPSGQGTASRRIPSPSAADRQEHVILEALASGEVVITRAEELRRLYEAASGAADGRKSGSQIPFPPPPYRESGTESPENGNRNADTGSHGLPVRRVGDYGNAPAEPPYVASPLAIAGCITTLVGLPKAGKSTLLAALVRAVVRGERFLGTDTRGGAVVWLTEERSPTFGDLVDRVGLREDDGLHVVHYHDLAALERDWPALMARVALLVVEVSAVLLIVDTLSRWARIEDELDAVGWRRAVDPLGELASTGLAIIANHHARKALGDPVEASRGNSNLSGEVDVVALLTRADGVNTRRLQFAGRFELDDLTIQLQGEHYAEVGQRHEALPENVVSVLRTRPAGLTTPQLRERIHVRRQLLLQTLAELLEGGRVLRSGTGQRGDPHVWRVNSLATTGTSATDQQEEKPA